MSGNEHDHPLDHFVITAARQGLITIPWYCQPPFTDEKKRILRRFNGDNAGSEKRRQIKMAVALK